MRLEKYLLNEAAGYSRTKDLNHTNWAPSTWNWESDVEDWDNKKGEAMAKKFAGKMDQLLKKSFTDVRMDPKVHNIQPGTSVSRSWRQFISIDFRNDSMTEPQRDLFGAPKTKRTGSGLKKFLPGAKKKTLTQNAWIKLRIYVLKETDTKYFIQPQLSDAVFPNWKSPESVYKAILAYAKDQ